MMTTTRYVVLGRDAERVFAASGWSRQMTDSPEFKTKSEAERFRDSLLVAWDRDDLRIERRVHQTNCSCGECEHAREVDEKVRLDIASAMPSDEDVSIGADDDVEAAQ